MYLSRLKLLQFKNINDLSLSIGPGFNFIIGNNGVGKTNIMDAIYYACLSKSFFQASDKLVVQHNTDFFRLEADFINQDKIHQLIIKYKPQSLKELSWDDKIYTKASEHIGKIPVVMIVPDDVFTFIHHSEDRRKFMDQTLVQIDSEYLQHLNNYNRILKQRNAALKLMKQSNRRDDQLLDIYEQGLLQAAQYIYIKRKQFIEDIGPMLASYSNQISQNKQGSTITFESDASQDLDILWASQRDKDFYTQRTNAGIHKDQLEPFFNEKPLRQFGSQGQIKTFLLALRLAQYKFLFQFSGKKPILILDDLFSKMDSARVQQLLFLLEAEHTGQCFITDTHLDRAQQLIKKISGESQIFQINDGNLALHETK
ncbi:MAG TPA: DNA replication and repair protein RecF [Saprospiraceae bacterium]|nr:DNA replication and repair protein RecF [Saprospiraceae bacterium]